MEVEEEESLFFRANIAKQNKKLKLAEELIKKAIKIEPKIKYRKLLVDIYFEQGKLEEAAELLNKLIEERKNEIESIKKPNREFKKKINILSEYTELLGRIYKEKGDYEAAIKQFNKSININEYPVAKLNLGLTYIVLGKLDEAEVQFDSTLEAIKEEEKRIKSIKNKDEKERRKKKIQRIRQNLCGGYYDLSCEFKEKGDKEKSRELWKKANNVNEDDKRILLDKIKLYISNGEYENAQNYLERGRKIYEQDVYFKIQDAKLKIILGNDSEAEELLKNTKDELEKIVSNKFQVTLDKNRIGMQKSEKSLRRINLELGKLYMLQEKNEDAEKAFKRCIETDENDKYALLELGKLYAKQGKFDMAKELFQHCIRIEENPIYAWIELGKIYLNRDNLEEAKGYFSKAEINFHAKLYLNLIGAKEREDSHEENIWNMIIKDSEGEQGDVNNLIQHEQKFKQNNYAKERHIIFSCDIGEVFQKIKESIPIVETSSGIRIYNILLNNAGYIGGRKGKSKSLNYITAIKVKNENGEYKLMHVLPSEKIPKKGQQEHGSLGVPSNQGGEGGR